MNDTSRKAIIIPTMASFRRVTMTKMVSVSSRWRVSSSKSASRTATILRSRTLQMFEEVADLLVLLVFTLLLPGGMGSDRERDLLLACWLSTSTLPPDVTVSNSTVEWPLLPTLLFWSEIVRSSSYCFVVSAVKSE